jgi:hypothetical protein
MELAACRCQHRDDILSCRTKAVEHWTTSNIEITDLIIVQLLVVVPVVRFAPHRSSAMIDTLMSYQLSV